MNWEWSYTQCTYIPQAMKYEVWWCPHAIDSTCTWRSMWMWSRSTNVRLYSILNTDMPLYDHTKIAVCVNCWGSFKWLPTFPWSRLTSFPGPAQLFIACHTASNEKLGGTWERANLHAELKGCICIRSRKHPLCTLDKKNKTVFGSDISLWKW